MSFLLVANFKSHLSSLDVIEWAKAVLPVAKKSPQVELAVAPSFPHLSLLAAYAPLKTCSQDVSPFPPGSYTGAVTAVQLKELGVTYCLVGHSERRRYFHESSVEVANKIRELISVGITPVLCLGEDDIVPQFAALDDDLRPQLVITFEPPEDIGGTVAAPNIEIKHAVDRIRSLAPAARILYGGSVHAENIKEIAKSGVTGVLVGTASLNPKDFIAIINQLG